MKAVKRIDDEILLQKISEGIEQKEIAAFFGVTPAAICKRLKQLKPPPPTKLDNLTSREKSFVKCVVSGQSQTAAALAAYDCGSRESAKALGHTLMKNPEIKEAIDELMADVGLTRRYRIEKLKTHVDNRDAGVSLRALDMSFKLADDYPADKHYNLNINADIHPVDLSEYLNKPKPE